MQNTHKRIFKKTGRVLITCLMAAMLAGFLFSCGKKDQPATESKAAVDPAKGWVSEHYNAEKLKGVSLNLYAVTDVVRPLLDEFQNDTGIRVENLTMKNGEILQRLKSEKESGVVVADIWFTGGADTFINAKQNDLLLAYRSPAGEALDAIMKDPEGYWYGTSLTVINWVVNKDLIEKKGLKMPQTWDDLLQPGLRGEVSMPNPASSGTAYNIISAVLQMKGDEAGWAYLEKLIPQVPFFTPRGSDPASLVVNGEAIVGINPSDGDDKIEKNNSHIRIVYPSDGTGWWPQPVAIVKGTRNEEAAKVFVDWLLSKKGMETLARTRNAAVARKDIAIPEGIIDLKTVKLFDTDFQKNAEKRDTILAEWVKRVPK